MAVQAYYTWDRLGRPLEPASPIRDFVEKMREAFPEAAERNQFSWYANDAHYQADFPQDHTPYSATGWPLSSPQWVVFATDIMHRPDLAVDCNELFPYWLSEARAGHMAWLKYMIYKATIYDVRNNWRPQPSSGHENHVHLSARTDHRYTRIGAWPITGDDMAYTESQMKAFPWQYNGRGMRGVPEGRSTLWVMGELYSGVQDLLASGTVDAEAIAAALVANPDFIAAVKTDANALAAALVASPEFADGVKEILRDQLNATRLQSD